MEGPFALRGPSGPGPVPPPTPGDRCRSTLPLGSPRRCHAPLRAAPIGRGRGRVPRTSPVGRYPNFGLRGFFEVCKAQVPEGFQLTISSLPLRRAVGPVYQIPKAQAMRQESTSKTGTFIAPNKSIFRRFSPSVVSASHRKTPAFTTLMTIRLKTKNPLKSTPYTPTAPDPRS